jgi:oxaloacetate decarboxylase gamma subunit
MHDSLMEKGLTLMAAGMGTVFVFLTALVIIMSVMSRLVTRLSAPAQPVTASTDEQDVAAITAAIALHRRRR